MPIKLNTIYRNTYFRYKFVRIVGNSVVDEGDFTGKSADFKIMLVDVGQQPSILLRSLGMAAVKTDGNAKRLRQILDFSVKIVFIVLNQKNSVVAVKTIFLQIFRRNADADLAEKNNRLVLLFV